MKMKQVIIILGLAGLLITFAACPSHVPGNETPTPEPTIEPASPTPLPVATSEPLSLSIREFQGFSNNGAHDWEYFTIDGEPYLGVANYYNSSSYNILSYIYKWNGATFDQLQPIPTNGAASWEYFAIGESHFLAVANSYNGSSYTLNSRIYKWDPNTDTFIPFQPIETIDAWDWHYFSVADNHFLAVANAYDGSTWNIDSYIYQWNGTEFDIDNPYPIATSSALDLNSFTIDGDLYLSVANCYNDSSYNILSRLYRILYG